MELHQNIVAKVSDSYMHKFYSQIVVDRSGQVLNLRDELTRVRKFIGIESGELNGNTVEYTNKNRKFSSQITAHKRRKV